MSSWLLGVAGVHLTVHSFALLLLPVVALAADDLSVEVDRKVAGLLLGSAIGDAAGGPVEFADAEKLAEILPGFRSRPDVVLDDQAIRKLGNTFPLLAYEAFRNKPEPYAHWTAAAPAGTVTDDTRNKMLLMAALRRSVQQEELPVTRRSLAEEVLRFSQRPEVKSQPGWQKFCDEWLAEIRLSARWELGERDPARALPIERMWGGAGTCCGQMMFPPLAGLYPGEPNKAYLATYSLGFIDNGDAKDINSAIVAGLAYAIAQPIPPHDREQRHAAWRAMLGAMRATDPLRHGDIEFMPRSVDRWIDRGIEAARQADRSPHRLYEEIAKKCPHEHAWQAKFLLTQAVALTEFSRGEPLAAMHLALDHGGDTDSAAQLMGAMFGALYGPEVFPRKMRDAVSMRLEADYGESIDEWVDVLRQARQLGKDQPIVKPLFEIK